MWCFPVGGFLMVKGERLEASRKGLIVKTEDQAIEVAKVLFLDHKNHEIKKELQPHFLKSSENKTTTQINEEIRQRAVDAQKKADDKEKAKEKAKK